MIGQQGHDIEDAGHEHQIPETDADGKARPQDGTDHRSTSVYTPGPRDHTGMSFCKDTKPGWKRKAEEKGEYRQEQQCEPDPFKQGPTHG